MSRPTTDLLILMVTGTICVMVLIVCGGIIALELREPGSDTAYATGAIAGVVSTFVGLVAGYMAGRTGARRIHDDDA